MRRTDDMALKLDQCFDPADHFQPSGAGKPVAHRKHINGKLAFGKIQHRFIDGGMDRFAEHGSRNLLEEGIADDGCILL